MNVATPFGFTIGQFVLGHFYGISSIDGRVWMPKSDDIIDQLVTNFNTFADVSTAGINNFITGIGQITIDIDGKKVTVDQVVAPGGTNYSIACKSIHADISPDSMVYNNDKYTVRLKSVGETYYMAITCYNTLFYAKLGDLGCYLIAENRYRYICNGQYIDAKSRSETKYGFPVCCHSDKSDSDKFMQFVTKHRCEPLMSMIERDDTSLDEFIKGDDYHDTYEEMLQSSLYSVWG